MGRKDTSNKFEVICNKAFEEKKRRDRTIQVQQALFPWPNSRVLIFVRLPEVTDDQFVSILEKARPQFVFELRSAPRFDIGRLNRKAAFEIFRQTGAAYFDFGHGEDNAQLETIQEIVQRFGAQLKSPLMFLASSSQSAQSLVSKIVQIFETQNSRWDVCEIPARDAGSSKAAG
jgi:hypothetical protein